MLKISNLSVQLFLLIFFTGFISRSFAQYKPIIPELESIYLSERFKDPFYKYGTRSTIEHQITVADGTFYYPYKTLTDHNNLSHDCGLIYTNSWLGDSIKHNIDSNSFTFHFTPIKINNELNLYELAEADSITLPVNVPLQSTFPINEFIEAKFIAEKTINWNGIQIRKRTYQLTNLGNPDYNWSDGLIEITQEHGIYNFPNLQYFPYEWRNCTLAGIEEGKKGLQDFTARDAFRMGIGDQFTAERRYYYAGPNFINYFERKTCIEIISETDSFQNRKLKVEKLTLKPVIFQWEYSIDTINEIVTYYSEWGIGKADEFKLNSKILTNLSVVGTKYRNELTQIEPGNCYSEYIDGCGSFVINAGFSSYYQCDGIFSFEDSYLLKHRIINGVGIGGEGDAFDSIRTLNNKIIDLSASLIYPNPTPGQFSISSDQLDFISDYYLIDISGKRILIKPTDKSDHLTSFEYSNRGMHFLVGIDHAGNIYKLGKILFHPKP